MYNQVHFYAKNTPSNASITLTVTLDKNYDHDEAIAMGCNVLKSWGVPECNFDAHPVKVEFFDMWAA